MKMSSPLMPLHLGAVLIVGLSMNQLPMAQLQLFKDLNRELGVLCQDPPRQALSVCKLHSRLLKTP